jgi:hypothetical protein
VPAGGEQLTALLPHVWEVAEAILADNPAIKDEPAKAGAAV